ncbi:MAG: recombinase family protein [Bacteroidales bacterium]|nr:recombinase family protein [Bacteroidales bacterium]
MPRKKVTAYIRVSTDRQSLENQRCEISKFASKNKMHIDEWIEEIVSGKVKEKDRKLGKYLKRMRKGDVLIVSELSRLSRTLLEIMAIVSTILEKGVILYSVKENCCLGDNINSKVILFAFGLAAEIERDLISLRTKEALASKRDQGLSLGRINGECPKLKMLQEFKNEILTDYASGMNISRLSQKFCVSRETMRKYLKLTVEDI